MPSESWADKSSADRAASCGVAAKGRQALGPALAQAADAQIAGELHISIRTVRSHLDRVRDKTGCRRRADLTRLALTAELI